MDKNLVFKLDITTYLEIVSLAQKNGKKPGDSMAEEMAQIIEQKREGIQFLGTIDQDKDMLVGNLRENGLKVLNLDELNQKESKKHE